MNAYKAVYEPLLTIKLKSNNKMIFTTKQLLLKGGNKPLKISFFGVKQPVPLGFNWSWPVSNAVTAVVDAAINDPLSLRN